MKIRNILPVRSIDVPVQRDYRKYRNQLAADFNNCCGYCGDMDKPRAEHFEIDHFVPQKMDSSMSTTYSNLVYACHSCNNAKRAKWPTGDINSPNDGLQGWIDPCDGDYECQFFRNDLGKIIPVTPLGVWMYDNLNLWKKQHEILWMYEQLELLSMDFEKLFDVGRIKENHKDMFIKILLAQKKILSSLYQ